MRASSLFGLACASLAAAHPAAVDKRQDLAAGYLAAVFQGDLEQVFFNLAPKDTPQEFRTLNGGNPYLTATLGTQGARDPSILQTQDGSTLYVLATDLKIASTDWGTAQRFGSRSIHIWESTDGVNWSGDRLAELMPPTAGYVWAPSAAWDSAAGQYAVFWSSVVFADDDTDHSGPAQGPFIYYATTTDFVTFSSAQRWDPDSSETVIDQEIQWLGGDSYVRYLSDTQQVARVVLDRSDSGLFGPWTRIGVPVDQVREGPASVRDINNPDLYYLWEDNYGGGGYECYQTTDFAVPFAPCAQNISPGGMRHGGLIQLDAARYEALNLK